ncbi:MAG: hypothetical protein AB1402_10165, partial [Bacillota bacterium]
LDPRGPGAGNVNCHGSRCHPLPAMTSAIGTRQSVTNSSGSNTATAADNIDTLAHLADGAVYPAVRPEVVAATPIVRPNDEVLGRFSWVAGPLLAKIAQSDRESRTLAALRDALLPKLISGELRVLTNSELGNKGMSA